MTEYAMRRGAEAGGFCLRIPLLLLLLALLTLLLLLLLLLLWFLGLLAGADGGYPPPGRLPLTPHCSTLSSLTLDASVGSGVKLRGGMCLDLVGMSIR
jgi:hypothetical protein